MLPIYQTFFNYCSLEMQYCPVYYPAFGNEINACFSAGNGNCSQTVIFGYPLVGNKEKILSIGHQISASVQTDERKKESQHSGKTEMSQQSKSLKLNRPKKNVQSNISNQVFSFIACSYKSRNAVTQILNGDQRKISIYFAYVEVFLSHKRKYLSRKYLGDLCILVEDRPEWHEIKKMRKLHILSLSEFRSIVAYLVFHYLRDKCAISILTSIKLSTELRKQHLDRRRQILSYLQQFVKPDLRKSYN